VKFPDADGFRHPVVLYDGLKNLLIVPVLVALRRWKPPRGMQTGIFLFLYAGLRLLVDRFREYPTTLLGLATGQVLNLAMAGIGLVLVVSAYLQSRRLPTGRKDMSPQLPTVVESAPRLWQPIAFALMLAFSLVIPSDWTQDIPTRYGKRHPGLVHSAVYPRIESPQKKTNLDSEFKDAVPQTSNSSGSVTPVPK
jgi:phosphatidylglycerol:prolipoprotein diacylglycerol transferase